jgi:hypothetical protein
MVSYILICKFLERRQENKRFWTEWWHGFPECNVLFISSFSCKHILILLVKFAVYQRHAVRGEVIC